MTTTSACFDPGSKSVLNNPIAQPPLDQTPTNVTYIDDYLDRSLSDSTSKLLSLLENGAENELTPSLVTIEKATSFLKTLYRKFNGFNLYEEPFVTSSGEEVMLEWWKANRKLTIFLNDDESHFLKSWGTDLFGEMDDGDLDNENIIEAWLWLITD